MNRLPSVTVLTDVGVLSACIRVDEEDVGAVVVSTDRLRFVQVHATLSLDQLEELQLGLRAMLDELRSSPVMG